jgi:hypothetical protein
VNTGHLLRYERTPMPLRFPLNLTLTDLNGKGTIAAPTVNLRSFLSLPVLHCSSPFWSPVVLQPVSILLHFLFFFVIRLFLSHCFSFRVLDTCPTTLAFFPGIPPHAAVTNPPRRTSSLLTRYTHNLRVLFLFSACMFLKKRDLTLPPSPPQVSRLTLTSASGRGGAPRTWRPSRR